MAYQAAPEIEELANRLIKKYPGQFGHLADKFIQYEWRDKHRKLRGKQILGLAYIQSGKPAIKIRGAFGTNDWADGSDHKFFCMEVAMDTWGDLTTEQREALVAHELCHMAVSDDGAIMIAPHDIEEFGFIMRTYGAWKEDLKIFGEALMDHMELDAIAKRAKDELQVPGKPVAQTEQRELVTV